MKPGGTEPNPYQGPEPILPETEDPWEGRPLWKQWLLVDCSTGFGCTLLAILLLALLIAKLLARF